MRDDEQRTRAYERAIAAHAPGRVFVDIGTGALALLAVMAAKAGARHVYAIEANAHAHAAAIQAVAAAGLQDRVTVLHGYSTDVSLPEGAGADLLLHEIIGEVGGAEGVVEALRDASSRLLAPAALNGADVVSVPARARTLLAPAEFPSSDYFEALPFPMLAAPGARALKLPGLPRSVLLAPAQVFEDLRFERASPRTSHDVTLGFVAARAGELRGLALHVEVYMVDGEAAEADVSSAEAGSHWPNVFLMLSEPRRLEAGERLTVRATARLGQPQPTYSFEVSVQGEEEPLGVLPYPDNL